MAIYYSVLLHVQLRPVNTYIKVNAVVRVKTKCDFVLQPTRR